MARDYETVILAALIHDIGKFWQRTGEAPPCNQRLFSPEYYERHGTHAELGQEFVHRYLIEEWQACGPPVLFHHNPNDRISRMVRIADWLSSGKREDSDPGASIHQLLSIFCKIQLGERMPSAPTDYYYSLVPLGFDNQAIFPSEGERLEEERKKDYAARWRDFTGGVEKIKNLKMPQDDFSYYFANLHNLLHKYAWCVPSAAFEDSLDISLLDHSRTASAIAACLWLTEPSDNELVQLMEDSQVALEKERFLLVGGNLSGIQSHLYEIANVGVGGISKRLRARSFYLNCLIEVITHRLLHKLVSKAELPPTCKLISSGGKFVLMTPNLEEVGHSLSNIAEEINHWLLREFQGDLSMLFATVPLSPKDFIKDEGRQISSKLDKLEDNLNQEKTRKFHSVLSTEVKEQWNRELFIGEGDYPFGDCPSCHKMPAQAARAAGEDGQFCPRCDRDRKVGEVLASSIGIAYAKGAPGPNQGEHIFTFFRDEPYFVVSIRSESEVPPSSYLVEFFLERATYSPFPSLLRPLANHVPTFANMKEFEDLCERCSSNGRCEYQEDIKKKALSPGQTLYSFGCMATASESESEELLGVLKGDVDRLGLIFSQGFRDGTSISRIAALSRHLDLFFSGWLHYTLETDFPTCYTVYSGGDDFLFVGPWDKIIDLAGHISKSFDRFVAGNKNITLSCGIAITKPKFPIAKSSKMAHEHLEEAKNKGRNRLQLFGTTVPWTKPVAKENDEQVDFDDLKDWAELLIKCLDPDLQNSDPNKLSMAFAHRLLGYSEQCRKWRLTPENGKLDTQNLLYMSHLAYDIARNIKDEEGKSEVKARLIALTDLANSPLMSQLRLSITWALLKHRR